MIWLREAFLKTRLPNVSFPELNHLEEIRIMLTERVLDWTQQWKQEGLHRGPDFRTAPVVATNPPPLWRGHGRAKRPALGADSATGGVRRPGRGTVRLRG